ncbi:class I SAM-dependent methyltransferase [Solicola sp. PLA-1-18]|uniref:class I SAM-dependent methyltransferase n=1 Tax=Solicola sp. PLA-1-18 TaxID=3380532 RepID=UPI003B791B8C
MAPSSTSRPDEPAGPAEVERANRAEWDQMADEYQAEHGAFLGDAGFRWSPEGADEADLHLLGDVAGLDVLEIGCGAAQCSRWLLDRGARPVGIDLSTRQLQHSRRLDDDADVHVPVVAGTATALPFADRSFDAVCSAFGALPFVADVDAAMAEVARVARPGGSWVFSVTHPVRWMFPDDPTEAGLRVVRSYFDREPYEERTEDGALAYAEHHRTVGDWVRAVVAAGFVVDDLVEPEWSPGNTHVWGGWGPERGATLPGTAILRTHLG